MTSSDEIVAGGGEYMVCSRCGSKPRVLDRSLQLEVNFDGTKRNWECPQCGHINTVEAQPDLGHGTLT